MAQFEYKVVPAPKRGLKARGIKGTEAMFANALATLMNQAAAEGWEYQRTDSLPCEERSGFTGRVTVFQNMLIFRRALAVPASEAPVAQPAALPAPDPLPAQAQSPAQAQTPVLAVPVGTPAVTAPAPVIAREVPSPGGALLLNPDPRVAATLTRRVDDAAAPAARPSGSAGGSQVAAE